MNAYFSGEDTCRPKRPRLDRLDWTKPGVASADPQWLHELRDEIALRKTRLETPAHRSGASGKENDESDSSVQQPVSSGSVSAGGKGVEVGDLLGCSEKFQYGDVDLAGP